MRFSMANVDELFGIFRDHLGNYPLMEPRDVAKLLYQNEFGPAHFAGTEEEALTALTEEMRSVEYEEDESLYEPVGNGYYRVNLAALEEEEYPLPRLAKDFTASARAGKEERGGSVEGLTEKLDWVCAHFEKLPFRFTERDWHLFLEEWEAAGYPPLSHSAVYRKAYQPAYRVVSETYRHDFLKERREKTPKTNRILFRVLLALILLLVAIGMAVLGKTLTEAIVK